MSHPSRIFALAPKPEARLPERRARGNTVARKSAVAAIAVVGSDFGNLADEDRRFEARRWAWRILGVPGLAPSDLEAACQEVRAAGRYVTCDELLAECHRQRDRRAARERRARELAAPRQLPAGRTDEQWRAGRAALRRIREGLG